MEVVPRSPWVKLMSEEEAVGILTVAVLFGLGVGLITWHFSDLKLGLGAAIIAGIICGLGVEWFYR